MVKYTLLQYYVPHEFQIYEKNTDGDLFIRKIYLNSLRTLGLISNII